MDEPAVCYYVDDQQCRLLEKQDIQLPEDYYFVAVEEKHTQQMCNEQVKSVLAEEKFVTQV